MKILATLVILAHSCTACGIQKAMDNISSQMQTVGGSIDSVSSSMKETNEGIKYTKDAIRKQTIALAIKEILAPENNTYVSPGNTLPTGEIPSGKLFAEVATPEEIAGIFFLWLTEINQGQVDPPTSANKEKIDNLKWIKLTALQVIAGFLPEAKLNEILTTQKEGVYAESVINILLLRHVFIATYLLDVGTLAATKINQAEYQAGLEAIEGLKFIEGQRGASEFALKLYGFSDEQGLGLNQTVELKGTPTWQDYKKKLDAVPREK